MAKDARRSGLSLVLAGLAGAGFFWLSDPRGGFFGPSRSPDVVDAINEAWPGTYIGIAGCAVVVLVGLWLLTRRTA